MSIGIIGKTTRLRLNPKDPNRSTDRRIFFYRNANRRAMLAIKQRRISKREAKQ